MKKIFTCISIMMMLIGMQVSAQEPTMQLGPTDSFGFLNGPDGEMWTYTADFTILDTWHRLLWYQTIIFEAVDDIVCRTTRSKLCSTVHAYYIFGTVKHGMMNHKHLAQVVFAFAHTQEFALQETEGRVTPACAATILVFHRSDSNAVIVVMLI